MRMYKKLTALLAISILFSLSINAAKAETTFNFEGNGFGHGVGLSQIGAKAMALEGKTAEEILKYYYTGVNVEPMADWFDVRVNIGTKLTKASIKLVSDVGSLWINDYQINDKQSVANFRFTPEGITTTVVRNKVTIATLPAQNDLTIDWTGTRFLEGPTAIISFNAGKWSRYQFGRVNLVTVGKSFEVTNTVRLKDEYLYGVSEVSSSWPTESLRAQAIAARTYAISKAGTYRKSCDCDLFGNTKDQLFVGLSKITEPRFGMLWKAAVDHTSVDEYFGLAITYKGEPINAFYSSSSGGVTESSLAAFGTAFDYLVPVADPISLDPKANPNYSSWQRSVAGSVVAKAFGLLDVNKLEIIEKRIYATSLNGTQVSLRLETFRSRAGLPSNFFRIVP
jgi:stage II sporulation protein D